MKQVTIGIGFITNSSSVVHHFDKALLEDPEVAAFVQAYELQDGFLGSQLYSRSHCSSFLVHDSMKQQAHESFRKTVESYEFDTHIPDFGVGKDNVMVVVYGDEYTSFASVLCQLLSEAAERMGKGDLGSDEFH